MIVRKVVTVAAAAMFATVSFAGMASAQTPSPSARASAVVPDRLVTFTGEGPTQAAAIAAARAAANDRGCQPTSDYAETGQNSDGSWWAWVIANCTIL